MSDKQIEIDCEPEIEKIEIINDLISNSLENYYVTIEEINEEDIAPIIYFIKYDINRECLEKLAKVFSKVEVWEIYDRCTIFSIDIENPVRESTADDMCKQAYAHHKKYNGLMKEIKFGITKSSSQKSIRNKIEEKIGNGKLVKYLTGEEIFSGCISESSSEGEY